MNDPFIMSVVANYLSNFSYPIVEKFFKKVFQIKPDLEQKFKGAKSNQEFGEVLKEAVGVIEANAGTGSIDVDNSLLLALKHINFDHQNGSVSIKDSALRAPTIQVGGIGNGKTTITNPNLRANGSGIFGGNNTGIVIEGNAGIIMS